MQNYENSTMIIDQVLIYTSQFSIQYLGAKAESPQVLLSVCSPMETASNPGAQ
uniref:Uncharacterized protein n=1 Tax=Arundo donax TaxID=35708 RepID=A0A0A9D8G1_ARUDO